MVFADGNVYDVFNFADNIQVCQCGFDHHHIRAFLQVHGHFLQGFVDDPEKLIGPITSIGLGLAGVLAAVVLMLVTALFMAANPRGSWATRS